MLLAGILTMHGLATTTAPEGERHLPLLEVSGPQLEFHPVAAAHAIGAEAAAALEVDAAQGAQSHHPGSGLFAGCMVVLAAVVLTVLLLALQRHRQDDPARAAPVETPPRTTPGAPPPRRPRISLCVLRV